MGKQSKYASQYPLLSAFAGGLTGAIEISISYPVEYVKVMMQIKPELNKKGMLTNFKETIRNRGVLGLYRGYNVMLFFTVPKNYVRFGTNSFVKSTLFDNKMNKTKTFIAGLLAGMAEGMCVVIPQETIKVRLIHDVLSEQPKYRGLIHGVSSICREFGLSGIYKGVGATILKQSTNQGVRFLVHGETKKEVSKVIDNNILADFVSGAVAGSTSAVFNNPIDVVKTTMQKLDSAKYKNTFDCVKSILANEGVMGFYKGVVPRVVKVTVEVSLTFTIFGQANDMVVRNYLKMRGLPAE